MSNKVEKDHKQVFSENLNFFMTISDKSRRDISDALGISYYTVTDWVNGKKMPRMDKVERLANLFGVSISDLIEPAISISAERLSEAINESNLSIDKVATELGVDVAKVYSLMLSRTEPDSEQLNELARILNVSYMWLLGYDEPKERPQWQKKNDQLAALFGKIRKDDRFFDMVLALSDLPDEQYSSVEVLLNALSKKDFKDKVE